MRGPVRKHGFSLRQFSGTKRVDDERGRGVREAERGLPGLGSAQRKEEEEECARRDHGGTERPLPVDPWALAGWCSSDRGNVDSSTVR